MLRCLLIGCETARKQKSPPRSDWEGSEMADEKSRLGYFAQKAGELIKRIAKCCGCEDERALKSRAAPGDGAKVGGKTLPPRSGGAGRLYKLRALRRAARTQIKEPKRSICRLLPCGFLASVREAAACPERDAASEACR